MKPSKVLAAASKLAQWRATPGDKAILKEARKGRQIERVEGMIRRYVTAEEFQKIRKRGCLHSVDFPEKRDRNLRNGEAN